MPFTSLFFSFFFFLIDNVLLIYLFFFCVFQVLAALNLYRFVLITESTGKDFSPL